MGSTDAIQDLPSADSPQLVLTRPTPAELRRIWTLTYPSWGPALSLEDYLEREEYLATVPAAAKDGKLTPWILTDSCLPPNGRPVLSSCDTYRKRAIVAEASSSRSGTATVRDVTAHGIGSVFTDPQFRGKGYASRMMREVGRVLKTWQADADQSEEDKEKNSPTNSHFSVLYSDIGKSFYAKHGWLAYESTHVSWTPKGRGEVNNDTLDNTKPTAAVRPIGYDDLPELCAVDEPLLRAQLPKIAIQMTKDGSAPATAVALLPNLDTMNWHLTREDFMCSHIFPDKRTPTIRGAVAGTPGQRIWAVWTRAYYGGLKKREGNTLHMLRVVVEDADSTAHSDLLAGFRGIIELAREEAAKWEVQEVQLWNPKGVVKKLVNECGTPGSWVEREEEGIASLMWYGDEAGGKGDGRGIVWAANNKFGWC